MLTLYAKSAKGRSACGCCRWHAGAFIVLYWLKAIEMKLLRWGFIGCGEVTEKKSGPAFNEVVGSEVVAVMSRNAVKARSYAERHGVRNGTLTPRNLSTTPT